ncbi:MAG: PPE domain-containing protein [Mycolicibacter algericus]|uniref:PPE family protein n=2 Tax=Mycolicibacter algericus TaxID=1288388 RepID=A0A7I9YCH9_MYCAL|nr:MULTISPECIES: PPE domain-containing protein [Mycobacteriaceae]OQZ96742.1 hypothetical protein BST10_11435 [Mycolicibacter algericus DSM 45454]GFG86405.1 PPE family protein [Mycolicibacter algericus]
MDFGLVPPEIQSALMYAGPGPGPISATAAAWDGLAAELDAASASYASLVTDLTSTGWLGSTAALMAAAVSPYLAWMHTTAVQCAETAAQVRAGVAAYEEAFAATVPPPVIATNRAELLTLLATNIFGQNTAAIAANQAEYAEMWAQDAAAMFGYASAASTATQLTPFTAPPKAANSDGSDNTTAAAAQAAGSATATQTQNALAGVPQTLQQLALPMAAPAAADPVVGQATAAGVSGISASSAYHTIIGSANFFQRIYSQFQSSFAASNEPSTTDIMERLNRIGLVTGAVDSDEVGRAADGGPLGTLGLGGFGDWHNWARFFKGFPLLKLSAAGSMGESGLVGGLSVPPTWAEALPDVRLAAAETTGTGVNAAPSAAGGGFGMLGAQAALTGMAGRALAGAVLPARENTRSTAPAQERPSSTAAKEIAEALREYASLRDSGIITEVEFNKHKERLMSLDPLSGR